MQAVAAVEAARALAPDNPDLAFIRAAMLLLALQHESGTAALGELTASHPDYWPAEVVLRSFTGRECHLAWPPWPESGNLHPGVVSHLHTITEAGLRDGLMPLVVVLTRVPSRDGVSADEFLSLPLELAVVDSGLRAPMVTAFVFRLGGDAPEAVIMEMLGRPFQSPLARLRWEILCRRRNLALVNVRDDKIAGLRPVAFGPRNTQVADDIARTLAEGQVEERPDEEFLAAVRRYQRDMPIEALPFEPVL